MSDRALCLATAIAELRSLGQFVIFMRSLISLVIFSLLLAGCASNRWSPESPATRPIFESPDVNSLH